MKSGSAPHTDPLAELCATTEYFVRLEGRPKGFGSLTPYAVREFANDDLRWAIHRTILLHRIDVLQIEYTNMGQYAEQFRQVVNILFEHDVYFQSIGRSLAKPGNSSAKFRRPTNTSAPSATNSPCSPAWTAFRCAAAPTNLTSPNSPPPCAKMQSGLRAGIDTTRYRYQTAGREPDTLLFLGSFRHVPNSEALNWFLQHVWPLLVDARPAVKLVIIGSDPPPRHSLPNLGHIDLIGFVDDVRDALARYALFICPILTGSGVRVKLLEAYAAGMPARLHHRRRRRPRQPRWRYLRAIRN
jgi:glycosyltransferase involved in cell wall biosynthesis